MIVTSHCRSPPYIAMKTTQPESSRLYAHCFKAEDCNIILHACSACFCNDVQPKPSARISAASERGFFKQLLHNAPAQVRAAGVFCADVLLTGTRNSYLTVDPEETFSFNPMPISHIHGDVETHVENRASHIAGETVNSGEGVSIDPRASTTFDSNMKLVPNRRAISEV